MAHFCFWNCPSRHALRAVCFEYYNGIGPRAGNLLAGMVTLRHAAGLPMAVREPDGTVARLLRVTVDTAS
jgi:hypothetical protein